MFLIKKKYLHIIKNLLDYFWLECLHKNNISNKIAITYIITPIYVKDNKFINKKMLSHR